MLKRLRTILALGIFGLLMAGAVSAQNMMTPQVTVDDQLVTDGDVTIESVTSESPGWLVIHADNGEGAPGAVIGYAPLFPGENTNVSVTLDLVNVTSTLFAMLHTDDNQVGVYEFGEVEGADAPVSVDGNVVTPAFTVAVIDTYPQFVDDANTVTLPVVTTPDDGWLVVHADNGEGAPGAVLGHSFAAAGTTLDLPVTLDGDVTNTLFPMLHVDTGAAENYEFGQVEGADAPLMINDSVAVTPFTTTPTINADDQIVIGSDITAGDDSSVSLTVEDVLSDGSGWLVVHADNGEGAPGTVIGYAPVQDGYNQNVTVELNRDDVTPTLFPMLHVDDGEPNVYEFGEVEGADAPVTVNGEVVVTAVNAAPTITYDGTLNDGTLTVAFAQIDSPGWLVVHADNGEGAPGAVIGYAPLPTGQHTNIAVDLDTAMMTDSVFPMLHYDTGEFGVYEFGEVEGADGPVIVNGNVVTGALTPDTMQ